MDESSGDPNEEGVAPALGGAGLHYVDGALARLAELDEAPLSRHPAIFEEVHRRLQDALAGTDEVQP